MVKGGLLQAVDLPVLVGETIKEGIARIAGSGNVTNMNNGTIGNSKKLVFYAGDSFTATETGTMDNDYNKSGSYATFYIKGSFDVPFTATQGNLFDILYHDGTNYTLTATSNAKVGKIICVKKSSVTVDLD